MKRNNEIHVRACVVCVCDEKFEDTKWVIRSRNSKKDRYNIGQEKKDKRTNNDLQNTTQKTKDQVTRATLRTVAELRWSGRMSGSCRLHMWATFPIYLEGAVVVVIVWHSWIYNYPCNQCLSPLYLLVRIPLMARCIRYNIMSRSGKGVQHYVIKFVSDLWHVGGFLWVLRFPPSIKLTTMI